MKENYVPTKDLKFSAKLLKGVVGHVHEQTKPITTMVANDLAEKFFKKVLRQK
ncbi:MAG: hypothetical protein Q7T54_05950 [Candidatus Levybacteria bacterium]|nr:hypothetical protein [Candidatus Levybacteria bacterium]